MSLPGTIILCIAGFTRERRAAGQRKTQTRLYFIPERGSYLPKGGCHLHNEAVLVS